MSSILQQYLNKFDRDVVKVKREVAKEYEITKILKENLDTPVLFENVCGHKVVGNLWSTRSRICAGLNIKDDELIHLLLMSIEHPTDYTEVRFEFPHVIDNVDLHKLPIPKWYPMDGGNYITAGIVFSEYQDKKEGKIKRNVSFHRLMVIDRTKLAIRIVPRHLYAMYKQAIENDDELPIVIVIGTNISVMLCGSISVAYAQDELEIASKLNEICLGKKLEVVKLDNGILVPTDAEYVLEGKITKSMANEGPFVDITGTYDEIREQPIVEIERIYHQNNPIFQVILPGGHEHYLLMGMPREPIILKYVRNVVPRVTGVRLTEGSCCWLHGIVAIKKQKEGDGKNAILAFMAAHPSAKVVIVVDDDIDISNNEDVEWAIGTRFQAERDLVIISHASGSSLDPSCRENGTTSKLGIDATKPLGKEKDFKRVSLHDITQ